MSNIWSHEQFTRFFQSSPKVAFEYRARCFPWVPWYEVPEEYRDKQVKEEVIEEVKEEETKEEIKEEIKEEELEITREQLIEKLENAKIVYAKNSKTETLVKKAIENNLL